MKFNQNGFVAWVVFGAEGERKPVGICILGPLFLLQIVHLVLKMTFCLLERVVSFALCSSFFGDKPVFNWLIPAPWASKPTPLSVKNLPKEVAKKRQEMAVSLTMVLVFGGFILATLWGLIMLIGLLVINNGLQLDVLSGNSAKDNEVYLMIHGVLAVAGVFLAYYLLYKAVRSESIKLLFGWVRAKKENVCPVVTFE